MDAKNIITIAQIIVSIGIVAAILLQNRGEGLGRIFGGGGEVFRARRGVENTLYYTTIGLAAVLVILSIVNTTIA